ncbi:desulfoferrodoxin [Candidatus Woesearchaeota archaeon]|nr:desulfoferrodoxin [Candidatus Woesearchaeota archaeon]
MSEQKKVFKCSICGNVVELLHEGGGELVCCGQPMKELKENTVDAAKEKHVPVIERTSEGVLVKVGSVPHPMEEKHYITWIELVADGVTHRRFLKPEDRPEALFPVKEAKDLVAREYCNLHGLWKAELG